MFTYNIHPKQFKEWTEDIKAGTYCVVFKDDTDLYGFCYWTALDEITQAMDDSYWVYLRFNKSEALAGFLKAPDYARSFRYTVLY